jgi:hypothetical protein
MPPLNPEIWHLIIGVISLLLGYFLKARGISIPGVTPSGGSPASNVPPLVALLRDALGQQHQQNELLGLLRELLGKAPDQQTLK